MRPLHLVPVSMLTAALLTWVPSAFAVQPNFVNEAVVTGGLTLPTAMAFLPDGRMLVTEFTGTVRVVQPGATSADPTPVITLPNMFDDDILAGGERGLVGILLDPGFAANGYFYLFYTADTPQRDRISRFTLVGNTADPATEVVIWQGIADSTHTDHHGGGMAFGPDGKMYISTGDNGAPTTSQSLTSDHGKILRVNPDGTVPTDNPFHDGAGPNIDAVWARGLRNPYRFSFDPADGKMYIGDVGQFAVEEINVGAAGANYGWPTCEGPCGTAGMTNPVFSYNHGGRDASVTGGFVYRASQFPASYQGVYFYGDYAQNWLRYLTLDAGGNVTGSVNFEPTDGTLDGPYGDPVHIVPGPDGALYYVDFGGYPGNDAAIRRVRYAQLPPSAVATAAPAGGPAPLTVQFTGTGSSDPQALPLSYSWTFGDGGTSSEPNPVHVYQTEGNYTARLTVSNGTTSGLSDPLPITVGNAPAPIIQTPANGLTFRAGDQIAFSGSAMDPEDGARPPAGLSWTVLFRHDSHVHPFLGPVTGVSGLFAVPTSGHDFSGNTRYEIILTATDSSGLQGSTSVTVWPEKVNVTLAASPAGPQITLDGIPRATPSVQDTLVGFQHVIEAPDQTTGGFQYAFQSWSDGGAQSHTITVPDTALTYTAQYQAFPLASLEAAYGFDEGAGTTAADASGNSHTGLLVSGPQWTTAGKYGSALAFDGGNANHVRVDTLALPTGDFTWSAWVKASGFTDYNNILGGYSNGDAEIELSTHTNGAIRVWFDGAGPVITTAPVLGTNTWHHVALRREGSLLTLVIDGAQLPSTFTDGSSLSFNCPFLIGIDVDGPGCSGGLNNSLSGVIDEVRVYSRALSLSEIQDDMNTPVGGAPPDTAPPVRSNGQPTGTLLAGTTQTAISLTTNENSTCRYATAPGVAYGAMTITFATTGGTSHSTVVTGLSDGGSYAYYVRCLDAAGNPNTDDFAIAFTVATPDTTPPTVSVTSPPEGTTVSGTVSVTADASDNIGVAGVQFLLDGANLGAEDTTAPYAVIWNTLATANGNHVLTARARDAAGNVTTSAAVNVTVENSATGPVAAYNFDEGAGTTLTDRSGNGNHGTLNGPAWSAQGKYGGALSFDGTNDRVDIPDSDSLDATTGLTMEAWVFPTVNNGTRDILIKEGPSVDYYNLYARHASHGKPESNVYANGTNHFAVGPTGLGTNAWKHVAGTYDGSALKLYVNGSLAATTPVGGAIPVSAGALRVGGNSLWGEYFRGRIDDVRIYNRALSASEVQNDMNTPVP